MAKREVAVGLLLVQVQAQVQVWLPIEAQVLVEAQVWLPVEAQVLVEARVRLPVELRVQVLVEAQVWLPLELQVAVLRLVQAVETGLNQAWLRCGLRELVFVIVRQTSLPMRRC